MNKGRRKELNRVMELNGEARALIEQALDILQNAKQEEDDYFNNMPEGLQQSERGQQAEQAISDLEEAISNMESAKETLDEADNNIESGKQ